MYTKLKRTSCFLMAVLMLFCACANILTQPAEAAFPIAIAVGVGALASTIFGIIGVTFASMNAANKASEAFYNSDTTVATDLDTLAAQMVITDASVKLPLTPLLLPVLVRLINAAKDFFSGNGTIEVNKSHVFDSYGVLYTDIQSFSSAQEAFLYAFYDSDNDLDIDVNGVSYNYKVTSFNSNTIVKYRLFLNNNFVGGNTADSYGEIETKKCSIYFDNNEYNNFYNQTSYNSIESVKYGFQRINISNTEYLIPYIVAQYINNSGIISYKMASCSLFPSDYIDKYVPITEVLNPKTEDLIYSIWGVNLELLTTAIESLQTTMEATQQAVLDLTDVYGGIADTAEGAAEGEEEQSVPYIPNLEWLKERLRDLGLTADIVDKITAGAGEGEGDITDTPTESDPDIPELPDLRDKFPFCVPFDLIALVGALNAPAEVPVFRVPVKMDFVNYEDEIVIDFSGFEKAAAVIRWGTTIFFILGLIVVSRKMIQA